MSKRDGLDLMIKQLLFSHGSNFLLILLLFFLTLTMSLASNGIYFWIFFGGVLWFMIPWFRFIDVSAIFIFMFSFFYGLNSLILNIPCSGSLFLSYIIVPLPLYCLGRWFAKKLKNCNTEFLMLGFILLFSITSILLFRTIVDILQNGIVSTSRNFEIEGVQILAATLYGMYASVTMVGIPMFFASIKKKNILSWLYFALALLGILTTFHLINRTGLVIAIVVTFVGLAYKSRTNIGMYLLLFLIISLIIYILFAMEIIPTDVIDAYKLRSERDAQLELSMAGGRSHRWIDAIKRMFYMPFGWYYSQYITGYTYVHNWWLDVARVVGIIPFFLLLIPTIISVKKTIKLFKIGGEDINLFLITLNVAIFLAAFVEPVMEGSVVFAYFSFFVWGLISQVANMSKC